jgi:predicted alpha/beta superfamily hydrolase
MSEYRTAAGQHARSATAVQLRGGNRAGLVSRTLIAVLCFQLSCLVLSAHAAPPQEERGYQLRSVPGGMLIEPTRLMQGKGIPWQHEIQIALPPSYHQTTKAYPVLWVTDGDEMFDTAVRAVALAGNYIPEMIVVAVGPPPEAWREAKMRRSYDFSPTEDWPQFDSYDHDLIKKTIKSRDDGFRAAGLVAPDKYGGASLFLSFLVDTVRPALAKDYRMATSNTLFGHSAGGVFCAYALLERPKSFDNYICYSPVLFSGRGVLFRKEAEYARTHSDMKADVFFAAGEAEAYQDVLATMGVVSSTARMVEMLHSREYSSLKLHFRVFQGEEHFTVVPTNLHWGLRAVWEDKTERKP